MKVPFHLLTIRSTNPQPNSCVTRNAEITAAFRLPAGKELKAMPAATEAEAICNLFEAEAGRYLVRPFATPSLPLADTSTAAAADPLRGCCITKPCCTSSSLRALPEMRPY